MKILIMVKCPNCGHIFESDETFGWMPDEDGDPTVEHQHCPKCGISTEPAWSCDWCPNQINCKLEEECGACISTDFDSFEIVEEREDV